MAENNWLLQDGRSILVEFDVAASEKAWGWFGNRSSGEGLEFDAAASAWTNHAWLRGGQMVQAAEAGGAWDITGIGQIPSAEAFGQPAVVPEIAPAGIVSAEAFGAPEITIAIEGVGGIASAEAFGQPTVEAQPVVVISAGTLPYRRPLSNLRPHNISGVGGIVSAETFGQPTVSSESAAQEISGVGGIASAEAFGRPMIEAQPAALSARARIERDDIELLWQRRRAA